MKLSHLSLCQAKKAIVDGDLCPVEYLDAVLQQIEAFDGDCKAFLRLEADRARSDAIKSRSMRKSGPLPPLYGIPFAIKDNIDFAGTVTTCQSRAGSVHPATKTAQSIQNLVEAGAIYIGKTTLDEFALASPGTDNPWPVTRNPWNLAFTPGSSSSGSGAAVAARMVPLAIGTDTGGSIRSPAMMNGIVGLKPTNGFMSMHGVFPLAPSMDTIGPMTRSVADAAAAFECLSGRMDESSSQSLGRQPRLGRLDHLWTVDLQPSRDMSHALDRAFSDLFTGGAVLEERTVLPLQTYNAVGWTTLLAEAFAIHRNGLKSYPEQFGSPLRELLLSGAHISASDYFDAQEMRKSLSAAIDSALKDTDGLVTAVSALPPCRWDDIEALDALAKSSTRIICNVTGHPSLALPIGLSADGVPVGLQIIGHKNDERGLLSVGTWVEAQISSWSSTWLPPLLDKNADLASGVD